MKNFLKNMFTQGWNGFKYGVGTLWHFISVEVPELMSNWRLVPRLLMMVLYGIVFYRCNAMVYGTRESY